VDEIEFALKIFKTQNLEVSDDNFLLDKERVIKIMEMILTRNLKMRFRFGNGIRADILDEENVRIMKNAGLYEVGMGVESADPDLFLSINKGGSFNKIENAISCLKNMILMLVVLSSLAYLVQREKSIKKHIFK